MIKKFGMGMSFKSGGKPNFYIALEKYRKIWKTALFFGLLGYFGLILFSIDLFPFGIFIIFKMMVSGGFYGWLFLKKRLHLKAFDLMKKNFKYLSRIDNPIMDELESRMNDTPGMGMTLNPGEREDVDASFVYQIQDRERFPGGIISGNGMGSTGINAKGLDKSHMGNSQNTINSLKGDLNSRESYGIDPQTMKNFQMLDGEISDNEILNIKLPDNHVMKGAESLIRVRNPLEERNIRLEESNRLLELSSDIIRHDLINPIGNIKGIVNLLLEEESDPQKREDLKMIWLNSVRAHELLENAKTLSKIDGMENLEMEYLNLKSIVQEATETLAIQAGDMGIEIENRVDGHEIRANKIISEVFVNLISNGIKYAPEGKRIVIDCQDSGGFRKIMVKDFGEGIKDEYKDSIFERFKRQDKKGVKGTGLGLSIVKKIVELHQGKISVEDNPEGGAVFIVELPK